MVGFNGEAKAMTRMRSEKSSYGIAKMRGPMATVYKCPCCSFSIIVKRLPKMMSPGRGFGLRTGGTAFSQMCAHVRKEHQEQPR